MDPKRLIRAALVAAGLLVASFLAAGCASKNIAGVFVQNQRPSIDLTQAPVNTEGEYFYAYRINWSGYDPDGQVSYYEYAIDPPTQFQAGNGQDTLWIRTDRQEQIFFFRASIPEPSGGVADTAREFHVFVVRAVDNSGNLETMRSAPKSRAFYSFTVAPTVKILRPTPSRLLQPLVTPSVRISWQGNDPDGQFTQKPVKYKYRLFRPGDVPSIQTWTTDPDSLRRYFGPTNFAGWDSTSAETTTVQFTNLTPGQQYLFVLVGFDEAGAFSPQFDLDSSMLLFNVGFASTNGPKFSVGNSFFFFQYASGGYTTDELAIIKIETAAGVPIDFFWFAEPPPGSLIEWYRWALDLEDLTDETPRTNELTDWYHWSQKSPSTNTCRVGPFPADQTHILYIEAQDNNGLRSLAIVRFRIVGAPLDRQLLIVDDTRLAADQLSSSTIPDPFGNRCLRNYTSPWPAAAELDTFLYARGNVFWRSIPNNCPTPPTTPHLSPPGVFAGYQYDTLGTRQGFERVSDGVPLSLLGNYKRIIWMVDGEGARYNEVLSSTRPMTALRFMSQIGQANTLAAYASLGGRVWMLGGASAYASLLAFNRPTNDPGLYGTLFSAVPAFNELVPSRMMYDYFHWRSELVTGRSTNRILKSDAARGGWSHAGRDVAVINAPNYSRLPLEMRRKTAATDAVPASRPSNTTSAFYQANLDLEYMTAQNFIVEDVDLDPDVVREQSTLDTLFALEATAGNVYPQGESFPRPIMTYYHGLDSSPMVFSGFNIWNFAREDVIQLVDFVLQEIWGMPRDNVSRQPGLAAGPVAPATIMTPAQQALHSRLPVGRTRGE